jgi:hypothetical protein
MCILYTFSFGIQDVSSSGFRDRTPLLAPPPAIGRSKRLRALAGDGAILATTRRESVGRAGVANNATGAIPGDRRIGSPDGAFARFQESRASPGSPARDLAGRTFRSDQASV